MFTRYSYMFSSVPCLLKLDIIKGFSGLRCYACFRFSTQGTRSQISFILQLFYTPYRNTHNRRASFDTNQTAFWSFFHFAVWRIHIFFSSLKRRTLCSFVFSFFAWFLISSCTHCFSAVSVLWWNWKGFVMYHTCLVRFEISTRMLFWQNKPHNLVHFTQQDEDVL